MSQKVAAYARVSSDKQADNHTIDAQIESLKQYAQSNGLALDADMIFIDNGVSGTTLVRPGLDALRDRALKGEIEKLIVLNPDRLARKHAHQLILVEEFARLGLEVIFANHAVGDSPEDQLLLQIQGVISEYEREKIRERFRRGVLHKARQGKVNVLTRAPYGYVYVNRTETEDARFEVHPIEAQVVREIFRIYIEEKVGLTAICQRLIEKGVLTRTGSRFWQPSTLWGMLKNPAYKGQAAFRKKYMIERKIVNKKARERHVYPSKSSPRRRPESEWIYIPVPAIIDEQTFALAQEQGRTNARYSPRNNKRNHYLLSSLAHCAECGYAVYGVTEDPVNQRRRYYRCLGMDAINRPQGRVCSQRPVPVDVLDEMIWEQTKQLILHPDLVLKEYTERVEKKKTESHSTDQLLAKKNTELRHQESEKQRLLDLYQHGTIQMKEIEPRLVAIRDRIKKIEDERLLIERESSQERQLLQLIEHFDKFASDVREKLDTMTFDERKKLVRLVVQHVTVDSKKRRVKIEHILPIRGPGGNEKYRLHSPHVPLSQLSDGRSRFWAKHDGNEKAQTTT